MAYYESLRTLPPSAARSSEASSGPTFDDAYKRRSSSF